MRDQNLKRRDFTRLTMAAFGGVVAGTVGGSTASAAEGENKVELTMDPRLLASEPHVCRGLNTCKGKDKSGKNACAGQGSCTMVAKHSCHGENECKGQGGCDGYPGQNTCKGKGHCSVPLEKETWTTARKQFEQVMKEMGHKVGAAPKV
ncbi:MAG: hypothetical protein M3552_13525 [Planctomycetota bacterium]|nr:hypothetical protein [Planctomycetota bacterium]